MSWRRVLKRGSNCFRICFSHSLLSLSLFHGSIVQMSHRVDKDELTNVRMVWSWTFVQPLTHTVPLLSHVQISPVLGISRSCCRTVEKKREVKTIPNTMPMQSADSKAEEKIKDLFYSWAFSTIRYASHTTICHVASPCCLYWMRLVSLTRIIKTKCVFLVQNRWHIDCV